MDPKVNVNIHNIQLFIEHRGGDVHATGRWRRG